MKTLYFSALICISACFTMQAQVSKNDSTSLARELTLEREYNPTIDNAVKLNHLPELREPQSPGFNVEFSNYTVPYSLQPQLRILPAQTYLKDLGYSDKKGYLTFGVSSLLNVDGDFGYQLLNDSRNELSIFASHRSSSSNVTYLQNDEKQKMKINDNYGGFNFLHHLRNARLNFDAKYTYSAFNYYGIDHPSNPSLIPYSVDKDKKQVNNMFEANAGISSIDSDEIGYFLNLGYSLFSQKYGLSESDNGRKENRFLVNLGLDKNINSSLNVGIDAAFKHYSYSSIPESFVENGNNKSYSILALNPHLKFDGDNWNLRLGVRGDLQLSGNKKNVFSPDVLFRIFPSEQVEVYALAKGGMKDNSNYNSFYINRYVDPLFRIKDSRQPLDAQIGVIFSPVTNMTLQFFGGYERINGEHFFAVSSPEASHGNVLVAGQRIIPEYRDVSLIKVGGIFRYNFQKTFEIGFAGVYNKWNENDNSVEEFVPWGKPSFTGDLSATYNLEVIPLNISAIYHLEADRELKANEKESNKNIHDLSMSLTYTLNETFSFYLAAHNLLFQKYDLWYGYPVQKSNIMGGINVKF